MKISERVKQIRKLVKEQASLRLLAEASGVSYAWVIKFSSGRISNPTVENIAKLESYFFPDQQDAA